MKITDIVMTTCGPMAVGRDRRGYYSVRGAQFAGPYTKKNEAIRAIQRVAEIISY